MEILDQLAMGLGFATLAGLNLYLTVLVVGLAIRFQFLDLAAQYSQLEVLGSWPVLGAAAVFFSLEFFADKVPWVDSLWDGLHTLIRPVGGGLLAMSALGDVDPSLQVVIALLAGGATLVSHGTKAGARLAINHSPEPVSNTVVSLAEDGVVLAGSLAALAYPRVTAAVCLLFLLLSIWLMPKAFRHGKATAWLLLGRLFGGPSRGNDLATAYPAGALSAEGLRALRGVAGADAGSPLALDWAVPVFTGAGRGLRGWSRNVRGHLVAPAGGESVLYFVGNRLFRPFVRKIELPGARWHREPRPLCDALWLRWPERDGEASFRCGRQDERLIPWVGEWLRGRGVASEVLAPQGSGEAVRGAAPAGSGR